MKIIFLFFCTYFFSSALAQKGNELLVYSLKGNVTVIENSQESKLKIGKVLKEGSSIKTAPQAKLTMVCKEGKPISVTREGTFPVTKWKDSCNTTQNSVTSKYFQYIWDQLYVRSDDYKKEHPEATASVVRGQPPVTGEPMEIFMEPAMETVYYSSGTFMLSWLTNIEYKGKYCFILSASKSKKQVYKDSIAGNYIALEKLRKYMKPGYSYKWSVATKQAGTVDGGIISCVSQQTVSREITNLQKLVDVHEDTSAKYFRTAFLLENNHYMADAFMYYQKAAIAAPEVEFYQEKLYEFKAQFLLPKM